MEAQVLPAWTDADRAETTAAAEVPGFPGLVGTFMGRDALSLAINFTGLHEDDTVLAPAFTCKDVLEQLARASRVTFYDVGPGFAIDPDEIRTKLKNRKIGAVLMTDYFGFLQPGREEIKAACSGAGAWLIEDCAHSLLSEGSGETGDLAIYSFRKILPVSDGGGVRVNRKKGLTLPAPNFYPRACSDALSVAARVKSLLNAHSDSFSRARVASRAARLGAHTTSSNVGRRLLPLSRFARSAVSSLSLPEVIQRRRDDFHFWRDICRAATSVVPVFAVLPAGVCPFGFPVKVLARQSLESRARRAGIPLQVHWRLDRDFAPDCRFSHEISAQVITLPLYPAIKRRDRDRLARIVAS